METRFYPICCQSMYCGKGPAGCPSCPNYPELEAFKAWRDRTAAVQKDRIWSPTAWTATHIDF